MTQQPDWKAEREAIRARLEAAESVVTALCHGDRKWTMSIPARPDCDPDLIISKSLGDIDSLLAHAEEDEREIGELRIVLRASIHALHSYKHGNASPDLADEIIERAERLLK